MTLSVGFLWWKSAPLVLVCTILEKAVLFGMLCDSLSKVMLVFSAHTSVCIWFTLISHDMYKLW